MVKKRELNFIFKRPSQFIRKPLQRLTITLFVWISASVDTSCSIGTPIIAKNNLEEEECISFTMSSVNPGGFLSVPSNNRKLLQRHHWKLKIAHIQPTERRNIGGGDCPVTVYIKGTVSRDFLPQVFFFKQLLLAPVDKPSNDFDFFRIFAEIFDYYGASSV